MNVTVLVVGVGCIVLGLCIIIDYYYKAYKKVQANNKEINNILNNDEFRIKTRYE